MKYLAPNIFALAVLALTGTSTTVHAQGSKFSYFPNDATINYAVDAAAVIGANGNGGQTSPTVNLVSGGSIAYAAFVGNSSIFNVSGGSIGTTLFAFKNSTINISGGSVAFELAANDSSNVTISGGHFGGTYDYEVRDATKGLFTLVGSNLTATNARPSKSSAGGTNYDIFGTLQDGTNLNGFRLNVADGSTFTLRNVAPVPELSTLVTLPALLATLGVVRKCRTRKQAGN